MTDYVTSTCTKTPLHEELCPDIDLENSNCAQEILWLYSFKFMSENNYLLSDVFVYTDAMKTLTSMMMWLASSNYN